MIRKVQREARRQTTADRFAPRLLARGLLELIFKADDRLIEGKLRINGIRHTTVRGESREEAIDGRVVESRS